MITWLLATLTTLSRNLQQARRSTLLPLLAPFLLLIAMGTLVYAYLERWTVLDALYATIITITTVGYGDLSPQTAAGRTFAIFFTLFAIGLAGYALSTAAAIVFEGHRAKLELKRWEQRMNQIAVLSNHVIVCGGGILANRAAGEFRRRNVPFVIIEAEEAKLKRTLLWLHAAYVDKRQRHYATLDAVDLSVEERKRCRNWPRRPASFICWKIPPTSSSCGRPGSIGPMAWWLRRKMTATTPPLFSARATWRGDWATQPCALSPVRVTNLTCTRSIWRAPIG